MAPTAIKASITARWALFTKSHGKEKEKKEVKSNDPGQHQSITVKTVMLDPFLAWSLQQNTTAASLPVFTWNILQRSLEASYESAETNNSSEQVSTHTSVDVEDLWTHVYALIKSLKRHWTCSRWTHGLQDCHSLPAFPLFAFFEPFPFLFCTVK